MSQSTLENDNLKTVQGIFEAFGRGDIPALLALCDENIRWQLDGPASVPYFGIHEGHAGVVDFFTQLGSSIEMQRFEPQEFISKDDRVFVVGGESARVRATGKSFDNDWVMLFTVKNGKVASFRSYENSGAVAEAFRS